MSTMSQMHIRIEGYRELLWHHFSVEALTSSPQGRRKRPGQAGNDPTEWRRTALVTDRGQLYIERMAVFGALREGARYTRDGRSTLQGPLAATLEVLDDRILIDRWFPGYPGAEPFDLRHVEALPIDAREAVYLDIRGVRNPSTKMRNIRYRVATRPGWHAEFRLRWNSTVLSETQLLAIVHDTGEFVGLGSGRSLGLGRFTLLDPKPAA